MPVITKAFTATLVLLWGGPLQHQLQCSVDAVNPQKRDVTLTTECKTDGSSAHYEETLSGSGSTMTRNTVSNTGCPNHVNWAINPNSARYISSDAKIPAYPMLIDSSSGTTDLGESAGSVGVMLNGVSLFSAWAGDGLADSYKSSATYLEGDTFDLCGGHATATGWYHYHNTAGCLQEQAMAAAKTTADDHSPQIGWSYDGFPIYGQLGPNGVEMLVCGNEGADETHCLDMCNGYEGVLDGVDNFKYRYYLSCGFDELYFPLTTNCYRGCCPSGISCGRHVENCGPSATAGFTSDYLPGALQSLDEIYDSELISGDDTNMINTKHSMDCSLYMGSYGVTDDDDDDEDGGYSGAARSHQSIMLVGTLSMGLLAAITTAIITALHVIFLIGLRSF